jgi:hypothetical protein
MTSFDRPGSPDMSDLEDRGPEDGLTETGRITVEPEDPAAYAARVIADEALSIFLAVEARTSEIHAGARQWADETRRRADEATAPALARLEAMSRDLEALATELDGAANERAARREHGG